MAVGLLLLTRLEPGDDYVASVLPAVTIFGLGLTVFAAPVTATVLAAADERHAGVASGVNNAVARVANLLAVAALPVIAGITGEGFYDPVQMTDGFHIAMVVCAVLCAIGGATAWSTISRDALADEPVPTGFSCDVAGPPLRPGVADR
jgi:hypothetical protein